MMKRSFLFSLFVAALAGSASAECYADYKAKRDDPLRLHYGVVQVDGGDCTRVAAEATLRERLAADHWVLLNVISVFDESGLAEREESAGEFYLRY